METRTHTPEVYAHPWMHVSKQLKCHQSSFSLSCVGEQKFKNSRITHVNGVHNVDPTELWIFHAGDLAELIFVTVFLDV